MRLIPKKTAEFRGVRVKKPLNAAVGDWLVIDDNDNVRVMTVAEVKRDFSADRDGPDRPRGVSFSDFYDEASLTPLETKTGARKGEKPTEDRSGVGEPTARRRRTVPMRGSVRLVYEGKTLVVPLGVARVMVALDRADATGSGAPTESIAAVMRESFPLWADSVSNRLRDAERWGFVTSEPIDGTRASRWFILNEGRFVARSSAGKVTGNGELPL